ncbi:MAG: bile acid:sodium symporter family protein [Cyclobacteriaceae bacterium]|nr:bile acid:sodium symporter family protein [Cyclobacteriaceae bacterium]
MQASILTTVIMPMALGVIMLGLGLSLTLEDFRRVAQYPRAISIALVCQMILLPALCFILALAFNMPPELAVGLMLLSASPGGPTANLYSHLSNGDVALNITLTAVNSLLTLFSLPFIVNLSLDFFMDSGEYLPMQFKKVMEVFAIVLVPVTLGMVIKNRLPVFAARMEKPVKILSALFLALVIIMISVNEFSRIVKFLPRLGGPVLAFNVLSMAVGYYLPMLFRVEKKQAIAIGMEIGLHNGTLAIYIALNVMHNSTMAWPPALYGVLMFFTAAVFGMLVNLKRKEAQVG